MIMFKLNGKNSIQYSNFNEAMDLGSYFNNFKKLMPNILTAENDIISKCYKPTVRF